jgi:hypothetical protein
MSWLFAQALVDAYSGESSSDGEPSAQLRLMPSVRPFLRNDKTTDASTFSRFGLTCGHLTADRGEELLTSFRSAFHAKTSVRPEMEPDSTARNQASGTLGRESFARWDRDACCWRTPRCLLPGDSTQYSGTWPKWGLMRRGVVWRLKTPSGLVAFRQWITSGIESGLLDLAPQQRPSPPAWIRCNCCDEFWCSIHSQHAWECECPEIDEWEVDPYSTGGKPVGPTSVPTMTCNDAKNSNPPSQRKRNTPPLNVVVGGSLNPEWTEWLMGWPIGWTDLKPLEMDKFQQWCRSHGAYSPIDNTEPEVDDDKWSF